MNSLKLSKQTQRDIQLLTLGGIRACTESIAYWLIELDIVLTPEQEREINLIYDAIRKISNEV